VTEIVGMDWDDLLVAHLAIRLGIEPRYPAGPTSYTTPSRGSSKDLSEPSPDRLAPAVGSGCAKALVLR
jgi:hypothetical protein